MNSLVATKSPVSVKFAATRHAPQTKAALLVRPNGRPRSLVGLRAAAGFEEAGIEGAVAVGQEGEKAEVSEALKVGVEEDVAAAVSEDYSPPAVDRDVECFSLNFLWLERNVGVAVDHWFTPKDRSPLTEYFFWPRADAWEELKACLESKPWISERDKVLLLNKTTEVINFWQDEETKHTMADAIKAFPDCDFVGH